MNDTAFTPANPNFAARVRDSFARQRFMATIGAELTAVEPGRCEIRLPYREDLTQQHAFFHGGVIGTLADNAAGYAAFSLMPADASVLTVEYKLNLLAPGTGEALTLCATALETLIGLAGRSDGPDEG
jgi:uncharacterized protein (TIGR00369 family)